MFYDKTGTIILHGLTLKAHFQIDPRPTQAALMFNWRQKLGDSGGKVKVFYPGELWEKANNGYEADAIEAYLQSKAPGDLAGVVEDTGRVLVRGCVVVEYGYENGKGENQWWVLFTFNSLTAADGTFPHS